MMRRRQDGEVLLARHWDKAAEDWRETELRQVEPNVWANDTLEVAVAMDSVEAWASLFPGIQTYPRLEACAPAWPTSALRQMRPWSLKGIGAVVFDARTFKEQVVDLALDAEGPILFPGGAQKLGLAYAGVLADIQEKLANSSVWDNLWDTEAPLPTTFNKLLRSSAAVREGMLDLGLAKFNGRTRRAVQLGKRPFGWEYAPRLDSHGAAMRSVDPGGTAEKAGVRAGDVILSIDGRQVFNSHIDEIEKQLMENQLPITLEIEQPVVGAPLYLREAMPGMLGRMCGDEAEEAACEVIPEMEGLIDGVNQIPEQNPFFFAGDGGTGASFRPDNLPQPQVCHVLNGMTLFGFGDSNSLPSFCRDFTEIKFLPGGPLAKQQADYLASSAVSIVACRPGDIVVFWGGQPYFSANGLGSSGPMVSMFYGLGVDAGLRQAAERFDNVVESFAV